MDKRLRIRLGARDSQFSSTSLFPGTRDVESLADRRGGNRPKEVVCNPDRIVSRGIEADR